MEQLDLFAKSHSRQEFDLPTVLDRIASLSSRPRYTFMVLNLIARVADASGRAGPYVQQGSDEIPVRKWLNDALEPMTSRRVRERRNARSRSQHLVEANKGQGDTDEREAERRRDHTGMANISRAVSDLVRAGLVRRHYQGRRVDHVNRGAQREAVYMIHPAAKKALGQV